MCMYRLLKIQFDRFELCVFFFLSVSFCAYSLRSKFSFSGFCFCSISRGSELGVWTCMDCFLVLSVNFIDEAASYKVLWV